MSIDDLGRPLGNAFAIAGGQARLYERGLTISGPAGLVEVPFKFPMIGKPTPSNATFEHELQPRQDLAAAIQEALQDRLCLVAVGQPEARVPLVGGTRLSAPGLQDRQLYDIAVRGDDGWEVVAPHAVYSRQSWTDFGIAHITDMHVAKRIDSFREFLRSKSRVKEAESMNNWNDRFRGFVRYANYLHSIGVLDVIVATGDNYDYQFEKGDEPAEGGNAAFLRDLILGKAPGPDFPDVEELRVPIFLTPGNHDYRVHPYGLIFDVQDVRSGVLAFKDGARVHNHNGYNLSTYDAILLANHLDGVEGSAVQNLQPHQAEPMVEYDVDLLPYRQCLVAEPGSYVVALGRHRIAMIDSAHDVGVVTETLEALVVIAGGGSENEDAFVGGSPNCRGITDEALDHVSRALATSDPGGLFIVGLHAPLFNPPDDRYPYFLRETQRASQRDQPHGYLARHVFALPGTDILAKVEADHPTWFPDRDPAGNVSDHRPARYVKRVNSEDHLDHGVSDKNADELMKLLAGVGSTRPADLVLAGHTHCFNEYRVGKAWRSDELAFYMDFYTQNPTSYYQTQFMRGWVPPQNDASRPGGAGGDPTWRADTATTYVEVAAGALPDASPWPMPFDALTPYMIQVPPYANPLNSSADPRAWWAEHRPLVLQTGALGPYKRLQFFSGFRVIAVKNDVIDKIHYVSTQRLEANQYRLDWEQAIQPEPGRFYRYVERSRPLGSPPAVGAPYAFWFPAIGATNVVYRDADGRIHELWRKGNDAGTSDLTTLASNAMRAADNPTSYIDTAEGLQVVVYRGTDDHVYTLYWSTGEVRRDALSADIDAPRAAGKPVGYLGKDGYRHAIYRARDGHVHELFWTGPNRPGHGDISTRWGAPHAAGDPTAYQNPTTGENNVFYRGHDEHIHRLFWLTGDVTPEDLSNVARSPQAAGDPAAYYTSADDVHQVVYRGTDGHMHELWWQGNNPVSHWDLTASAAGAPAAANDRTGDPVTYYNAGNNTKHVIYRSADGHLNELSWVPGTATPTHVDVTAHANSPRAADKPSAFVVAPNHQHVFYRGDDNQIHEIRWSHPIAFLLEEAIQPNRWG